MQIQTPQRRILVATLILVALMTLFPPWTQIFKFQTVYNEKSLGYNFIANPPSLDKDSFRHSDQLYSVKINHSRITLQLLAVLALSGAGILIVSGRKRSNQREEVAKDNIHVKDRQTLPQARQELPPEEKEMDLWLNSLSEEKLKNLSLKGKD